MSRWGHGHSIGIGLLLAVSFTHHLLWLLTLAFVLGVAVGRGWSALGRLMRSLAGHRWPYVGTTKKVW